METGLSAIAAKEEQLDKLRPLVPAALAAFPASLPAAGRDAGRIFERAPGGTPAGKRVFRPTDQQLAGSARGAP